MVAERGAVEGPRPPRLVLVVRAPESAGPAVDHGAAPDPPGGAGRSRAAGLLLPVVTWVLGAAVFFRDQLTSGFDTIMGNAGDARLVVFVHEHWWSVLGGHEAWNEPGYFHPTKDVLGYCDTFVLNTIVYAPLRAAGLDPFLAFQWTLVVTSAIGFAALFAVLRTHLHVHPAIAAGGGLVYCFANNLFVKAGHAQLLGSWWTPVCALAGAVAVQHRDARVRLAAAAAFGALASLIVYSSFYAGWAAVMAAALMGLLVLVARPTAVLRFCRTRWPQLAAALAGAALGAVPFVLTYLPVLAVKGGRSYAEVRLYATQPWDVVNVGTGNWLWGSTLRDRYGAGASRLGHGELTLAVTPVLALSTVLLAVAVAFAIARARRRRRGTGRCPADSGFVFACAGIVAAIALVVLPLDFDGWSLWRPIWEHVPGASAIRATARMQVVASQLAAVSFAICLSRLVGLAPGFSPRRRLIAPRLAAAALVGLVLVEQLNLTRPSVLDRPQQLASFRAVPAAPSGCTSFFLTSSGPPVPELALQVDAMLIANSLRIPTLNGYSGQSPDGWMLGFPQEPAYVDHVREWATAMGTTAGLCGYDAATGTWDTAPLG